jgi:hypothetical protein
MTHDTADEPTAESAERLDEAQVIDAIRRFHQQALDAKAQVEDAKAQVEGGLVTWRAATWPLAEWVQRGKKEVCGGSTKKFNKWLKDNRLDFLSPNDRAALVGIAAYPAISRPILEKTTRTSWQTLWREEIEPEVKRVCRPTNSGKKNGQPKDDPPPRSPLDEMLAQNLIKIAKRLRVSSSRHAKRGELIAGARQCFEELAALLDEYDGGLDSGPSMEWGTAVDAGAEVPF